MDSRASRMVGGVPTARAGGNRVCIFQHGVVSNTAKASTYAAGYGIWTGMERAICVGGRGSSKSLPIGAQ